jgi:hypothetical protein
MKKLKFISAFLIIFMLTSCSGTLYLNDSYLYKVPTYYHTVTYIKPYDSYYYYIPYQYTPTHNYHYHKNSSVSYYGHRKK